MIQSSSWWVFLVLGPVIYWGLVPARLRPAALAAGSLALLAPFLGADLLVMAALAAFAYAAPRLHDRPPASTPAWVRPLLRATWAGWAVLLYLVWAKYLPALAGAFAPGSGVAQAAVPLGVSYFAFKLLHYAIESGRRTLQAHGPGDFVCWLFLAPTFTAGPIERFDHFLANRQGARLEGRMVGEGLVRIAQGLVKKFVAGALVLEALDRVAGRQGATGMLAALDAVPPGAVWALLFLSLLYLYLDFSAYSDIAIGSSRLFGLGIMENFNLPFLARNLQEYWQRWHMTLAHWCRSYIYMSMIGLTRNPYAAILATFLTMGAWHAASLHWVAWGLWHGTGVAALAWWGQLARRRRWAFVKAPAWAAGGWALTLAFVALGGAFTTLHGRAPVWDSVRLIGRAFGINL